MRVLTFNSHQPYIHLMAMALPWNIGVITPRLPSGAQQSWNERIRPLPENIRLYSSAHEALEDSDWDWVLTHNVNDLIDTRGMTIPKVFLVHGTLSGRMLQDKSSLDKHLYLKNLRLLLDANNAHVLYISDLKRKDWGIPGNVLKHGIDCSRYGGYRGNIRGILQVCNHLKERGPMTGWSVYESVCRNLPSMVLGQNPGLKPSRIAHNWEDLKEKLRSYRVYIYTPVFPYEDGYNLALLEAMATGMPIASLEHPTSPVRDGIEGVISSTVEGLREKVVKLLDDPACAKRLGDGARKRVEQQYSIIDFQKSWVKFAEKL